MWMLASDARRHHLISQPPPTVAFFVRVLGAGIIKRNKQSVLNYNLSLELFSGCPNALWFKI
jgi:hypothetical protein